MNIDHVLKTIVFFLWLSVSTVRCESFSIGGSKFASSNFTTLLGASTTDTSLQLTTPISDSGVAIYPQPVNVHLGFTTRFEWNVTECNALVDVLSDAKYTDGVSFFISETNPSDNIGNNSFTGMESLNNSISIGYVSILNEFHVCDWQNPPDLSAPFFRRNCRIFPYMNPRLTCGTYSLTIQYNDVSNTISVSTESFTIFEYQLQRKFNPIRHYLGFVADNDNFARQQEISLWIWSSTTLLTEFKQEELDFVVSGARVEEAEKRIRLAYGGESASSVGVAIQGNSWTQIQQTFSTYWTWSSFDCGEQLTGDEGFAMLFSKTRPGGFFPHIPSIAGLGIPLNVNLSFIGYNHALNEFYVCKWNTPVTDSLSSLCPTFPSLVPRLTCDQSHAFEVLYNQGVIKVSVNGMFLFAAELPLDAEPHTIGFSGSAGNDSYSQYISEWSFKYEAFEIQEKWNIANFSSHGDSLTLFGTASLTRAAPRLSLNSYMQPLLDSDNYIGGVVHKTPFTAHNGFESKFGWTTDPHECNLAPRDGITMFLTSDPASLQIQNLTHTDLGLKNLHNVITISFPVIAKRQISVCKWSNFTNPAVDFRDATEYCTYFNVTSIGPCSPYPTYYTLQTWPFIVRLSGQLLTLNLGTQVFAAVPMTLTPETYYMGLIGADHSPNIHQSLSSWSLKQYLTADYREVGFSLTNNTQPFVHYADDSVIQNNQILVPVNRTALTIYKTPLPAHLGFTTSFYWRSMDCSKPSGFNFFLTKTHFDNVTSATDIGTGRIGTAALAGLTSVSFTSATNQFRAYFNSTRQQSSSNAGTFAQTYPPGNLCNKHIAIEYTTANILNIHVDGYLYATMNNRTSAVVDPSLYFIGISATGGNITGWNYYAIAKKISFDFTKGSEIDLFGTASIADDKLRLTTGGSESGVGMYSSPVYAHTGFKSTLTWTPSNCDEENNGADGFTLFLSKSQPTYSQIYASSGGYLGVGNIPDVVMFAYSATYNEFYLCNWTTPLGDDFRYVCDNVVATPVPKMTCPNTYVFEYYYEHETFSLRVNGTQQFTASLMLEPVPYFVGLSGATGGGYFQQDVSHWEFQSIAL